MIKTDQIITPEESRFGIQELRSHPDPWGNIREVQGGLNFDWRGKRIQTLDELREKIEKGTYFFPRHARKIDRAIDDLKDEGVTYRPE